MLKILLKEKNISVYKCSKDTHIPYTTLNELVLNKKNIMDCNIKTIYNLSKYFNYNMESIIESEYNKKNIILANDWEEMKSKTFIFPKIVNTDKYPIEKIHPLMQKQVDSIFNYISNNEEIKKIYLFGSSTNIRCNRNSDLDFAIELKNPNIKNKNIISDEIGKLCNYNCDIVWIDQINDNEKLINNIEKGVLLYEQITTKS